MARNWNPSSERLFREKKGGGQRDRVGPGFDTVINQDSTVVKKNLPIIKLLFYSLN